MTDQSRERVGRWGIFERCLLVGMLTILATVQMLVVTEVFQDQPAEVVETLSFVFDLFGIFLLAFTGSMFGCYIERFSDLFAERTTEAWADLLVTLGWSVPVFAMALVYYVPERSYTTTPEFAELIAIVILFLAGVFTVRAVYPVVSGWLHRRDGGLTEVRA